MREATGLEAMPSRRTVKIDAFPESAFRYLDDYAVVCIDVLSASTTLVTAVGQGRLAVPVVDLADALRMSARLPNAMLAVEEAGPPTVRQEVRHSPAALARRPDGRPLVVAGTTGTQLLINASGARAIYVACLRNLSATVEYLAANHSRVVLLGAGFGHEFRCEDQMAAARIAAGLMWQGFEPEDLATADLVARWAEADLGLVALGKTASFLRRWGQQEDVDFVMAHVDDMDLVCRYREGMVTAVVPRRHTSDVFTTVAVVDEAWPASEPPRAPVGDEGHAA